MKEVQVIKTMRKIFLENLPKRGKSINWKECIGDKVRFIYDDIEGEIVIVGYNKNKKGYLTIKYKNYNEFEILTGSFQKCKIGAYLNNIIIKAPWMISYFQGGYDEAKKFTCSSHTDIYPICPYCGRVLNKKVIIKTIYNQHSIGCSCSDSIPYGEKIMFSVLEQFKIEFQTQLNKSELKWCNKYKYDFYFEYNDEQYICEVNGGQHYIDSWDKLDKTQENDKLKKQLALKNGIKPENYIIINCRYSTLEWIRDNKDGILNSRLNELFDLSKIDWIKAEEFALSNRVKEACEYKKNNLDITATEIGKIMNLSKYTIRNYLKRGNGIWCHYDAKEEQIKSGIDEKSVEIFKNDISLGVFKSICELSRQSLELFGIKLYSGNVSKVCLGERKSHGGFTFKHC